ncbi:hypothetical protein B484DRAFT_460074 [Ochromonadaceae sp. CCMP2298]|nr:hypothetical protein B484DRAFT_460074 [Ochromonadaceae sp. CCMP2298]|mmetsp:Transcript_76/g.154  ORF Transcript_76/g.154 Transcript_76/m.154 type:complete len:162 (+) Transcript_76:157-642(+)
MSEVLEGKAVGHWEKHPVVSMLLWVLGTRAEVTGEEPVQDSSVYFPKQRSGGNLTWKDERLQSQSLNEYFSVADFPSSYQPEDPSAPRQATSEESPRSEAQSSEQFLLRFQQQQQQQQQFQFEYSREGEGSQGGGDWDFHVAITPPTAEHYSHNPSPARAL